MKSWERVTDDRLVPTHVKDVVSNVRVLRELNLLRKNDMRESECEYDRKKDRVEILGEHFIIYSLTS